jgi:hypothetical protein
LVFVRILRNAGLEIHDDHCGWLFEKHEVENAGEGQRRML